MRRRGERQREGKREERGREKHVCMWVYTCIRAHVHVFCSVCG